jgi:hypothetical protein
MNVTKVLFTCYHSVAISKHKDDFSLVELCLLRGIQEGKCIYVHVIEAYRLKRGGMREIPSRALRDRTSGLSCIQRTVTDGYR